MQFNRHSIFLKLNILFLMTLLAVSTVFFILIKISEKREIELIRGNSRYVSRILRSGEQDYTALLAREGFSVVENKEAILANATPLPLAPHRPDPKLKRFVERRVQILEADDEMYFYYPSSHILIQNRPSPHILLWIFIAYAGLTSVLFLLYLAIFNALKPIKKLEKEIKKFSDGQRNIDTKSDKKDEIANVSNEFDKAAHKIQALQNTRTLFLRNLMHELKTPITKGKLSLSFFEESKEQAMLEKVFHQLDTLINEVANIEQITTQNTDIVKKPHRLLDIIEYAADLLYLDNDQIHYAVTSQTVVCDFRLFSLAVKNLIDNAVKYRHDNTVSIEADTKYITFINNAAPLSSDFSHYLEPFYKGEVSLENQKGFGLGLYIVSEILKIHHFTLSYAHREGKNIFTIHLS